MSGFGGIKHSIRSGWSRVAVCVAVVSAAAGIAACGGSGGGNGGAGASSGNGKSLKQVSFMYDVTASGYDAPFLLADEKGWYADEGLKVKFSEGTGSTTTVQLVANGRNTFGLADFGSMTTLLDQGAKVKGVMVIGQESPVGVIALANGPIHTMANLYGHKLLLNPRGASAPLFKATMAKLGLDQSKINTVNTTADVTNDTLLARHRVDAFVGWETFELPGLKAIGQQGRVLPFRDAGVNVLNIAVVASDSTIQNDPQTVKGFVTASLKGWNYAAQHPSEAVDVLVKRYPNVKPDIAMGQLQQQLKLLHTSNSKGKPIGWASPKDVASTQDILLETHLIKTRRNPSAYYTDQFISGS